VADIAEQYFSLPAGTRVEEYELVSVIGHGSFGITYLAEDTNLGTRLAIKEYLPKDWAIRDSTQTVRAKNTGLSETLERGKQAFLNEARILARVTHPNIVSVRRFFRAYGTAYIVMDFIGGRSLGDILDHDFPAGGYPSTQVKRLVVSVLEGLSALHGAGIIHRDLKPGNILIEPSGNPILVDFGAARNFQRSLQRGMTVIMTPGYAPIEQYSDEDEQGPFTDIYAVGALAYRAITGRAPEEPYKRLGRSSFVPASAAGAGRYPAALLTAIDWALAVQPQDRPQSAAALLTVLRGVEEDPAPMRAEPGAAADEATRLIVPVKPPISPAAGAARSISAAPVTRLEKAAPAVERAGQAERREPAALPSQAAVDGKADHTVRVAPAQPAAVQHAAPNRFRRMSVAVALAILLMGGLAAAYVFVSQSARQSVPAATEDAAKAAEAARQAEAKADAARQAAVKAEAARQAAAKAEADRLAAAKAEADRQAAVKAESARQAAAKAEAERQAAAKAEADRQAAAKAEADRQAAAKAEADRQAAAKAEADRQAAAEADRQAAAKAETDRQAAAKAETDRQAAAKAEADRQAALAAAMAAERSARQAKTAAKTEAERQAAEKAEGLCANVLRGASQGSVPAKAADKAVADCVASAKAVVDRQAAAEAEREAARKKPAEQEAINANGTRKEQSGQTNTSARLTDTRCTAIVETTQLGEALSDEDRTYLRDHCR